MSIILRTEELTHIYGEGTPSPKKAVESISLSISKGELIGLIGHTGSGKSTLIQHLNGLLKPSSGRVFFEGKNIWSGGHPERSLRFKVGMVFQYPEHQLFEETVYRDIAFGPVNMGLNEDKIRERVFEAAEFTGLSEEMLQKSPFELSGGQKRRAAIAGVIAMRPDVLILDEPTAGLDPRGSDGIMKRIVNYHRDRGGAVVLVSHNMEEVAKLAGRIIVLKDGRKLIDGTPTEVFQNAGLLVGAGIMLPQITRVFLKLREQGVDIDPSVYTVSQAAERILAMKEAAGCSLT